MTRTEGDVGEMMVPVQVEGRDGPEDDEIKRSGVEEREEMLVERLWDGGELKAERGMSESDVSAEERSGKVGRADVN